MGKVKAMLLDQQEEHYFETCRERDQFRDALVVLSHKYDALEKELQMYRDDEYHVVGQPEPAALAEDRTE